MDGSALSCESLIEREVVMKVGFIRESFYYLALIKSVTNTIRGIKARLSQIQSLTLRRITDMRRKGGLFVNR